MDDGAREGQDEAGEDGRSKGREQNVIHGGEQEIHAHTQGAWGGPKRAPGDQFNGGKGVNAARDYKSRNQRQRDGRGGQEGPSSKKRDVQGSDQRQEGARRNRGRKS